MDIKKPNSFARYGNNYVAPLTTIDQIVKPSGERYTDKEFELMSNVENVMFGENSAGKNLLNQTLQTTTINGVTCTNNGDGTYTLNGTATGNRADFPINNSQYISYGKDVKVVGCPQGGGSNFMIIYWAMSKDGADYDSTFIDNGSGVVLPFADETYSFGGVIRVENGATVNNLVFKPMITDDLNATYDDFEPYVKSLKQLTDSALNMDLLWTNASPTSEFAPQTIELDLSGATLIAIEYRLYNTYDVTVQLIISEPNVSNTRHKMADERLFYRIINYIQSDGINFGNAGCYNTYGNGTGTINNTLLIPYKIFKIK